MSLNAPLTTATPENSGAAFPISGQEQSFPRGHPPVGPEAEQDMIESVVSHVEYGQEAEQEKVIKSEFTRKQLAIDRCQVLSLTRSTMQEVGQEEKKWAEEHKWTSHLGNRQLAGYWAPLPPLASSHRNFSNKVTLASLDVLEWLIFDVSTTKTTTPTTLAGASCQFFHGSRQHLKNVLLFNLTHIRVKPTCNCNN